MMISQYEHPYPAVKGHYEGRGWRTDAPMTGQSEGLLWVVRTQETIDRRNNEETLVLREYELGTQDQAVTPLTPTYADEYVLADRVDLRDGHLIFELGTPQHIVSTKTYAPGYWREFHLLSDAHETASRTATMLKDDDDAEV